MTGIPRHLMPQIPKEELPNFLRWIHKRGASISRKDLPISKLLPVQKHVNREKVDKFKAEPSTITQAPILITSQGFVVDGHHRWLAARELGSKTINCIIFDVPLLKFLKLCHGFDGSYTKSVNELTTYGRWAVINENNVAELEALKTRLQSEEDDEDVEWVGYGYRRRFDSAAGQAGYVPGTI